jgi:hypothetical protein
MSNPEGPGQDAGPVEPDAGSDQPDTLAAEQYADPETEVLSAPDAETEAALPSVTPGERRFTAPSGMDAGFTQIIDRTPDPATEIIDMGAAGLVGGVDSPRTAVPQEIPPRDDGPKPRLSRRRGGWGWVLAVILVIAALAAVAILGTLLLSRKDNAKASQQDLVRSTIHSFDGAIQKGDLATLRSITCGETADGYNKLDDRKWADTHARVAAAQQYPVVASIDEVVVNGDHAEANVTSFMAFDPSTRSTRSFDLEFRDEQWKICQAPGS